MAAPTVISGERSFIGWLVPASIALHVVAVVAMPSTRRAPPAKLPVVIEMMDPPPPPKKKEEPPPEPTTAPRPTTAPPRATTRAVAARPQQATTAPRPAAEAAPVDDAPLDLTGTTLSNTGEGIAVGGGGGPARPSAPAGPVARVVTPPPARLVPPSSLARPPRAPGLDSALERNYPATARRAGVSGKAVLRVRILPDGRVGQVTRISESYDGFGVACERTVKGARWEPPIDRDGSAVSTEITYVCRFEVRS